MLELQAQTSVHSLTADLFVQRVLGLGAARADGWSWVSTARGIDELVARLVVEGYDVVLRSKGPWGNSVLVARDDLSVLVVLSSGKAHVQGAAAGAEALARLQAVRDLVAAELPRSEKADDQRVGIQFWTDSPHGPVSRYREIDVPTWQEVAANYPQKSRVPLGELFGDFVPGHGGQLLLWHGPPGTGKTYALRALAYDWRAWCDIHYVTDPEAFFGNANYMLDVLLADSEDESSDGSGEDREPDLRANNGRWKLLVLEDTGELMSADARERSGQGLSRLLNVVDGLIGQGLRILALVTNEQVRKLHPAVSRPGRCASLIEFPAFTEAEAAAWIGDGPEVGAAPTLADLFALRDDREPTASATTGFAR